MRGTPATSHSVLQLTTIITHLLHILLQLTPACYNNNGFYTQFTTVYYNLQQQFPTTYNINWLQSPSTSNNNLLHCTTTYNIKNTRTYHKKYRSFLQLPTPLYYNLQPKFTKIYFNLQPQDIKGFEEDSAGVRRARVEHRQHPTAMLFIHDLLQFTTTPNIHLLQLTITIYYRLLQIPIPGFEEEFATVHYNFQY